MRVTLAIGVVAVAIAMCSPTLGAQKEIPLWKKALPGTGAFLGDDGGGVNTVTVCDTADRFRDWLAGEHPAGCQTFQHDLPATMEIVTYDPAFDRQDTVGLPIAKSHIPSRQFVGYLNLLALHPIIPPGTVIHFKRVGNETIELFSKETIGNTNKRGVDLGNQVSAKIVKYDPTNDNDWDLQVQVLDGTHAGQTGWMLSVGADGEDGVPIDQFDKAAIDETAH